MEVSYKNVFSKRIKRSLSVILFAVTFLQSALAQHHQIGSWGDQGNGTYINPILNADYSDPDVIKKSAEGVKNGF